MSNWIALIIIGFLLYLACRVYLFCLPIGLRCEEYLGKVLTSVDLLANHIFTKNSKLPGSRYLRSGILLAVLLGSVVFIVYSLTSGITIDDISDGLLGGTSIGQMLALLGVERFGSSLREQFTFTTLVSIGLSSFISFLYMRCTIDTIEDYGLRGPLFWVLLVLFNMAFLCISTLLSSQIDAMCMASADILQALWAALTRLFHSGVSGLISFFKVVFSGLALLLMVLCGLMLLVLTVREVVASLTYGFMSLLLTLVVGIIPSFIQVLFPMTPEWIMRIFVFLMNVSIPIAMFLPDYFRATNFFAKMKK